MVGLILLPLSVPHHLEALTRFCGDSSNSTGSALNAFYDLVLEAVEIRGAGGPDI